MGPMGSPETSVTSYKSTLCNISEERRTQIHRARSLKTRKVGPVYKTSFNIGSVGSKVQTGDPDGLPHKTNTFSLGKGNRRVLQAD